ncbi:hypothetical protein [Streptomyces sp. NPDC019224]|uniref:hypothetical protein n=1 Tax=Streptomyces sp. NPDC019224 TaxID=3154484 RepID=UPI0033CFF141
MDAFSAVNSGLSHDLVVELTVYSESPDELSSVAFRWLTEGLSQIAISGELQALQKSLRVSKNGFLRLRDSIPARKHGALWGTVFVSSRDSFETFYNPYVEEAFDWLKVNLDERSEVSGVEIGGYSEAGEVGGAEIRLHVSFDDELPNYVKLSYHFDEAILIETSSKRASHSRLLHLVKWACGQFNVVFGHLSYVHAGGRTELESCLRGPGRIPTLNTPKWRDTLRGYSWLTVVSQGVVQHLGGVEVLGESNAFHSISILPNGSVMLQATSWFDEYRESRVKAVYRALREVLVQGEFRKIAPAPGRPSSYMVVLEG